jgi:predicted short-subunit dehydrogenase-like oxidoreductase (DUF2520 family)
MSAQSRPPRARPSGSAAAAADAADSGPQADAAAADGGQPMVGIVGAGRVGAVLGAALIAAGYPVTAVSGRSHASRSRAATLLPGVPRRGVSRVLAGAELVIFAVSDDSLAPLVAHLAEGGHFHSGQVVAHTSGAHGVGILHPAVARGAAPIALHPAMTFTGTPADLDRLAAGISFGVTATEQTRPLAQQLVEALHGTPEWVDEQHRSLYHAALAHGANHLVTLVNEAMDRLREAGVLHPDRVLRPLLGAALDNTLRLGDAALTGPVSRGDAGTVAKHLDTLSATAPDSVSVYRELARRTADRAIAAGRLSTEAATALLDVLANERAMSQEATR